MSRCMTEADRRRHFATAAALFGPAREVPTEHCPAGGTIRNADTQTPVWHFRDIRGIRNIPLPSPPRATKVQRGGGA